MNSLTRWMAVPLAAVLLTAVTGAAQAESWRMSHKMPPGSIEGRLFQQFADKVGEYTGGKITVKVFSNEQLGKDESVLEQLQIGTIHVYPEGGSYLQKWVPDIKWMSAPFMFQDRGHWQRFMNSDLAQKWAEEVEKKAGILVLGDQTAFLRGPYRVMVTKRDVKGLNDIQGLRLRLHPDQLAASAWKHLGAEVRVLAWTEVYESISRGIVEAVNSPIALVEPMRFYEVAPHVIRHDEYPQGIAFMMNAKAYRRLDETTRKQVLKAYDDVAEESQRMMREESDASIARMKGKGVDFEDIDTSAFVERMRSFYEEAERKGEMPKGFLQAVTATRKGS
jgi:TRAP-type C4-dicarboxylate transport system substrate-binding protein